MTLSLKNIIITGQTTINPKFNIPTPSPTPSPTPTPTPAPSPTPTPPPPDPTNPNIQIWYDVSTNAYISFGQGSAVSAVSNKATTVAHDANKGGGVNTQPTYVTNIQNGLSSILFDGNSDYLTVNPIAQLASLSGATMFIVAKLVNTSVAQILTTAGTNNANINGFNLGTASSKFVVKMAQGVATSDYTTDTNYHVHTIIFDGSLAVSDRIKYRIDGTQRSLVLSVNPNTTTSATLNQFYIGADATNNNYYSGYLGEIIIYTKALNLADIQAAENLLKTKWAIA